MEVVKGPRCFLGMVNIYTRMVRIGPTLSTIHTLIHIRSKLIFQNNIPIRMVKSRLW